APRSGGGRRARRSPTPPYGPHATAGLTAATRGRYPSPSSHLGRHFSIAFRTSVGWLLRVLRDHRERSSPGALRHVVWRIRRYWLVRRVPWRSEAVIGGAGCLNGARPDLWEYGEQSPGPPGVHISAIIMN